MRSDLEGLIKMGNKGYKENNIDNENSENNKSREKSISNNNTYNNNEDRKVSAGLKDIITVVILFFAVSFLEFVYLELFFKKVFTDFSVDIIIKNVVLIIWINLVLVSIIRSIRTAFLISCIAMLIIGVANYFVIAFRGYGIVFIDFYAVKTAATVAGEYSYSVDFEFVAGFIAALAGIALCFVMPYRKKGHRKGENRRKFLKQFFKKISTKFSIAGIVASGVFIIWINTDATFFRGVSSVTWDHNIGINDYGYLLYFVANADSTKVDEPAGYSVKKVDEILSAYEPDDEDDNQVNSKVKGENNRKFNNNIKNPNIIMIMNESFSDLRVLGNFTTNKNVLEFYDSLDENTIKGYVQSSVYGGYTSNSEFEFLTGCSKVFLPGNPYLQYMDDYLPSIISNIKSQEGYGEAVAIHPYNASGYNRNRVYPLFYFDDFLTIDDFADAELVREYVSDLSDYKKIEELYEKKKEGNSLCIFNVTMQNHNPYDYKGDDLEEEIEVTSFDATQQADQYLSLMKLSDDALRQLITYFEDVDEPVIILLFGDHQPHLPDSFYQSVMGKNPIQFTRDDIMKKHEVPFLIWANYDIPELTIDRASINYLSSIFLNVAGLKMSNYNRYLLDLYKKLPAISAVGSYDKDGGIHDKSEKSSEYAELMKEYEMIQYNYLFDEENRLDEHYIVQ